METRWGPWNALHAWWCGQITEVRYGEDGHGGGEWLFNTIHDDGDSEDLTMQEVSKTWSGGALGEVSCKGLACILFSNPVSMVHTHGMTLGMALLNQPTQP